LLQLRLDHAETDENLEEFLRLNFPLVIHKLNQAQQRSLIRLYYEEARPTKQVRPEENLSFSDELKQAKN